MKVFNKKYCLIKKKYYICITKLITHLKTNKMKNNNQVLSKQIYLVVMTFIIIILITINI